MHTRSKNSRVSLVRSALLCFLCATVNPFVSEARFVETTAVPLVPSHDKICIPGNAHPFVAGKQRLWEEFSSSAGLNDDGGCVPGSIRAFVLHLRGGSRRNEPGIPGRHVVQDRTKPLHEDANAWRGYEEQMDMEDDGMEEEELTDQQRQGLDILR